MASPDVLALRAHVIHPKKHDHDHPLLVDPRPCRAGDADYRRILRNKAFTLEISQCQHYVDEQ
jgi:hypothetical protein